MKNSFFVSFHLEGHLPPNDVLLSLFDTPLTIHRRGEYFNDRVVEHDRASFKLDTWRIEPHDERSVGIARFHQIASMVANLAPALHQLNDPELEYYVRVGMVRRTEQGGLTFPLDLLQVFANIGIQLHISMTIMLPEEDSVEQQMV